MLHRPGRSYSPRALGSGRSPAGGENVVRRALIGKLDFFAGCLWAEAAPSRVRQEHNTSTSTPSMWSGAHFTERVGAVSASRSLLVFVEIRKRGAVPFQSVQSVSQPVVSPSAPQCPAPASADSGVKQAGNRIHRHSTHSLVAYEPPESKQGPMRPAASTRSDRPGGVSHFSQFSSVQSVVLVEQILDFNMGEEVEMDNENIPPRGKLRSATKRLRTYLSIEFVPTGVVRRV